MLLNGLPRRPPGNTNSPGVVSVSECSSATVGADSGTRCSRPDFIRSADTVHNNSSRSASRYSAPRTSLVREAVRITKFEGPQGADIGATAIEVWQSIVVNGSAVQEGRNPAACVPATECGGQPRNSLLMWSCELEISTSDGSNVDSAL